MTLKAIEIKRVKGIENKLFELEIIPNKPSLLVAPNGFGKSSLSIGFDSMNNSRINLDDDDRYLNEPTNSPEITITYEQENGSILELVADENSNRISDHFSTFVIRSPLKPKASANYYGGASASLQIEPVTIVSRIPDNESFDYSVKRFRDIFGSNGKVLPNISDTIFKNLKVISTLYKHIQSIERAEGKTFTTTLQRKIDEINDTSGLNTSELLEWIDNHLLEELMKIRHFSNIAELMEGFDLGFQRKSLNYLAAIQIIWLFQEDKEKFKNACKYSNYKLVKSNFESILFDFNTTWKNIKARENNGKLIVTFPKATEISNGQRDILSFVSTIFKAQSNLKKDASILIIDEVFDYLDDANLVAAQYYITKLIGYFKKDGRRIYPLILTHLNPRYFKNYAFKEQKVYYLEHTDIDISHSMKQLLKKRELFDNDLREEIAKKLFHFHPEEINKRPEFEAIGGLKVTWGEGWNFQDFIMNELNKYLENDIDYDPFAVCCAVRVKIEEDAFNKIASEENQEIFLNTRTTRKKLDKAVEFGIAIPESHYLLALAST